MNNTLRKVKVNFHPFLCVKQGLFHHWESNHSEILGCVEFEDGTIQQCDPSIIVFNDQESPSKTEKVYIKIPQYQDTLTGFIHLINDQQQSALVELPNGSIRVIKQQWIQSNGANLAAAS